MIKELTSEDQIFIIKSFNKTAKRTIHEPVFLKLLSRYVRLDEVNLKTSPRGKPFIEPELIHFSIAHSANILVVAFSKTPIGIDIEQEKPRNFKGLSDKYGFRAENAGDFYRAWTAREAFIKLRGGSIAKDLRRIKVLGNQASANEMRAKLSFFKFCRFYGALAQKAPKKCQFFEYQII